MSFNQGSIFLVRIKLNHLFFKGFHSISCFVLHGFQLDTMKLGRRTCSMVLILIASFFLNDHLVSAFISYCSWFIILCTLSAIQFVITGHQFQQLTQANLAKMLYSSSAGVRVKSAYVEIIVDNKDKSIRVITNLSNILLMFL